MAAMQIVLGPFAMYEDPIVRKYYLAAIGVPLPDGAGPNLGPNGESLVEPPASDTVVPSPAAEGGAAPASVSHPALRAAPSTSATIAAGQQQHQQQQQLSAADVAAHDLIFDTWQHSEDRIDVSVFQSMLAPGRDINFAGAGGKKWTALMVVSGLSVNKAEDVAALLAMGADPFQQDAEGSTALHWAAIHGCAFAISTITAAFSSNGVTVPGGGAPVRLGRTSALSARHATRSLLEGLAIADSQGLTALALAERELATEEPGSVFAGRLEEAVAALKAAERQAGREAGGNGTGGAGTEAAANAEKAAAAAEELAAEKRAAEKRSAAKKAHEKERPAEIAAAAELAAQEAAARESAAAAVAQAAADAAAEKVAAEAAATAAAAAAATAAAELASGGGGSSSSSGEGGEGGGLPAALEEASAPAASPSTTTASGGVRRKLPRRAD